MIPNIPFLNNCLGDLLLDPFTFRVLTHLSRVHQSLGYIQESLADGAKHCLMGLAKYRTCIHKLKDYGVINIEQVPGDRHIIRISEVSGWDEAIQSEAFKKHKELLTPPVANAVLDNMRLPVNAFRLYAHIVRRCSKYGVFYESYLRAAENCALSIHQFYRALKVLTTLNLITIFQTEPYTPNQIKLKDSGQWDESVKPQDSCNSDTPHPPIESATPIKNAANPYQQNGEKCPPPPSDLQCHIYKDLEDQKDLIKIGEGEKKENPLSAVKNANEFFLEEIIANKAKHLVCDLHSYQPLPEKDSPSCMGSDIPRPRKKSKKLKWPFQLKPGGRLEAFRQDFLAWVKGKFKLETLYDAVRFLVDKDRGFENTDAYLESLWEEFTDNGAGQRGGTAQKRSADDVFKECMDFANNAIAEVSEEAKRILRWCNGREWFKVKATSDPVIFKAEFTTHFNQLEAKYA